MKKQAGHGAARRWFRAEDVMAAARGRWASVLGKLGVRVELLTGRHGPCPGCGGRDRFRFDDQGGDGTFLCSQGGKGNLAGNGLALLAHCTGWEWRRCVEEVGRALLPDSVRVSSGEGGNGGRASDAGLPQGVEVAPEPVAEPLPNVPPFELEKLERFVAGMPPVTRDWLRSVSPCGVGGETTVEDFLGVLYAKGERVLVFTRFTSQGDFLHEVGRGSYRLARRPGVKAERSPLPDRAPCGVWFLNNPVTGAWEPPPGRAAQEQAKLGRRHAGCVTRFRYVVLESDEAPEELWLRALVRLELPIVAIYTSGGKSVHALVRIEAKSKAEWDAIVRGKHSGAAAGERRGVGLVDLVCPLGADPGALSAVRLSRLPFCLRLGTEGKEGYKRYDQPRKQELLWLSPPRLHEPPRWRSIESRPGLKWEVRA